MSEHEFYDLIIVGGGPGGLTAGMYAMRAALKTVLIEKGAPGGQVAITKGVENYPGFIEIGGFELCDKFLQHAKWYGLEIIQQEAPAGSHLLQQKILKAIEEFTQGMPQTDDITFLVIEKYQ